MNLRRRIAWIRSRHAGIVSLAVVLVPILVLSTVSYSGTVWELVTYRTSVPDLARDNGREIKDKTITAQPRRESGKNLTFVVTRSVTKRRRKLQLPELVSTVRAVLSGTEDTSLIV